MYLQCQNSTSLASKAENLPQSSASLRFQLHDDPIFDAHMRQACCSAKALQIILEVQVTHPLKILPYAVYC